MEKLNVRFSDTQKMLIEDVSNKVELDASKVARAAMRIGLQQIMILANNNNEKAKDLVSINDEIAKQ